MLNFMSTRPLRAALELSKPSVGNKLALLLIHGSVSQRHSLLGGASLLRRIAVEAFLP